MKKLIVVLLIVILHSDLMAQNKFSIGDKVQSNANLNVRSTAGGAVLGTQLAGTQGTVTAGPVTADLSGVNYTWYQVTWPTNPTSGWSVQDGLDKVSLLPAAILNSPSNGASGVSTTPTFSWSTVSGANRYWLIVSTNQADLPTDPNAVSCPGCIATGLSGLTGSTSYTPPVSFPHGGTTRTLSFGTTYYWKVQGYNTDGTQGNYSNVGSFTTAILSAPTLTSIIQKCDGTASGIEIQWTSVNGASNYEIYRNSTLIHTTPTAGTVFWDKQVTAGQSYSYQIKAKSGSTTSSHSNSLSASAQNCAPSLSFTSISPSSITTSTAPYSAILSASGDNFNNVNQITFTWNGATSGSTTWNKGDANWNAKVTVNSNTSMTLNPQVVETNPTWSGTDSWTVTLKDNTGATGSRTFSVTYTPPVVLPDLTISANPNSSYTSGQSGVHINVTVNRSNGNLTNGTYALARLYFSTNSTYDAGDTQLWESNGSTPDFPNNYLNSNGSKTVDATVTIPVVSSGTYYILAFVDPVSFHSETNESNNLTAYQITVQSTVDNPPNITAFNVSPTQANTGTIITISYTVTDDIGLSRVELWRGIPGATINDTIWSEITPATQLSSAKSYSGSFTNTPSIAGTYYYGIHVVDSKPQMKTEKDFGLGPTKVMITSSSSLGISSRIMAASGGVKVRNDQLGDPELFVQDGGVHGTITEGPKYGTAGGFTGNWWKINWDSEPPNKNQVQGYSAESLILLAPSAGDVSKPNFSSSYYTSANIFWQSGNAPSSTNPPNPQLGTALGNCTWYVHGRMCELGYNTTQLDALHGNASDWDNEASTSGISVDFKPSVGSIAQTDNSAGGLGYVAVVESVNGDGTITVTESSYSTSTSSTWNFLWRHRTVVPTWFDNFIHVSKSSQPASPIISEVLPSSYPASSSEQTMTINGSNFQQNCTLTFTYPDGSTHPNARSVTFVSDSQLSYQFNNANDAGKWYVMVNNPDGQSSSPFAFNVQASSTHNPTAQQVSDYADSLSIHYKVPAVIIKSVLVMETVGWDQSQISADGGIGLMQITPSTFPNFPYIPLGRITTGVAQGSNAFMTDTVSEVIDNNRLKSDWRYNLEIGVRVLVAKKVISKGAGDDATILENWYYPLAYYNGAVKSGANDPSLSSYTRSVSVNNNWKDKSIFPYQECIYNIIAQLYSIPSDRVQYFGTPIKVTLPGPAAVGSGAGHYSYAEPIFCFYDWAQFFVGDSVHVGNWGTKNNGCISEKKTDKNITVHVVNFGSPSLTDALPVVASFQVSPTSLTLGNSVTVSYSVTDDIGLKKVELWRTIDSSGSPKASLWKPYDSLLVTGKNYSGTFSDTPPSTGIYWYGVHVVDTKGNYSVEPKPPGPSRVTVNSVDTPPVVTSFHVSDTLITLGDSVTVSHSVTDDIGLKQVELWRTVDSSGVPKVLSWKLYDSLLVSGKSYSGSFSDIPPATGTYWYGVHVVDTKGQWGAEPKPPGPTKVTVNSQNIQTIRLVQGWNMISSYIQPSDSVLDNIFTLPKPNLVLVKNGHGEVYWPALSVNSIGYWSYKDGYQLYVKNADSLIFSGNLVEPETSPISLANGWNLVAYLRNTSLQADAALAGIVGHLVIAKDGLGHVYWPSQGINTIGSFTPGAGYQMYVDQAIALTYPANDTFSFAKVAADNAATLDVVQHYPSVQRTGSSGTLLVRSAQFKEGDEVGVWSGNGALVGSGAIKDGRVLITVWGRDIQDDHSSGADEMQSLSLKLWSSEKQEEILLSVVSLSDGLTNKSVSDGLHYKTDAVWIADVKAVEIPKTYSLEQNYPNPFNPSTTIRYGLPEQTKVVLEVYNTLGQRVALLANETEEAGYHEITFNAHNLSSGIYFYVIRANKFSETKKLLLVK